MVPRARFSSFFGSQAVHLRGKAIRATHRVPEHRMTCGQPTQHNQLDELHVSAFICDIVRFCCIDPIVSSLIHL